MGTSPCSSPARNTTSHSRPLAAWKVASTTASRPGSGSSPRRVARRPPRKAEQVADGSVARCSRARRCRLSSRPRRSADWPVPPAPRGRSGPGPAVASSASSRRSGRTAASRLSGGRRPISARAAADLRLVEEGAAAAQAERDARGLQRPLEQHQLGVGAGEHRHLAPTDLADPQTQGGGDGVGLLLVGGIRIDRRHGAAGLVGPHAAWRGRRADGGHGAVENCVGHGQDLGCGSVVVVEPDDLSPREPPGEAGEVGRIGAVPRVDGLVGVPDHAEVGSTVAPRLQQPELQGVDVLELVDEQVAEAPALGRAEPAVVLQGGGAEQQEVVEVDLVLAPLLVLVALVEAGDRIRSQRRPATGGGRGRLVAAGRHHPGLGPLDLGGHVGRLRPVFPPPRRQQLGQDPDLAVEDGRRALVVVGPPPPELAVGDRVEGAGGHLLPDAELAQPGAELRRRPAGEGEGQDVRGDRGSLRHPPGDAPGEDAGLARPGAGEDAQGGGVGDDCLPLGVVEPVEKPAGGSTGRAVA